MISNITKFEDILTNAQNTNNFKQMLTFYKFYQLWWNVNKCYQQWNNSKQMLRIVNKYKQQLTVNSVNYS